MFEEIISAQNLEAAYLELVEQFAKESKEKRYRGIDNKKIFECDLDSRELLSEIKKDLIEKNTLEPAILLTIPKKNNPAKYREIFIYTLKERVKAQAIYRVVLPVFEATFSSRLFSYRPGRPPYIASYLFARRYKRHYTEDNCLVIDLQNYSNLIDKQFLVKKIEGLFHEQDVREVLKLFIFNRVYDKGIIQERERGIVQGVPLIALFANLYLNDLDVIYDRRAAFYIRVGDDLAIVDPSLEKLQEIKKELTHSLEERGLKLNQDKFFIGHAREKFSFLGYTFTNGTIRLEDNFVTQTELRWKKILVYKYESPTKKKLIMRRIMRKNEQNFNQVFQRIIKNKSQVNDSEQIRKLSEKFFRIMTEFFYGTYSPRYRREAASTMRNLGIFSLYSYYKSFHYERGRKHTK